MQETADPGPVRAGYGKIAAGIGVAVTAGLLIYFYFFQDPLVVPADSNTVAVQSQTETAPPVLPVLAEPEPQMDIQDEMPGPVPVYTPRILSRTK